jgi:hypothetical protein
LVIDLTLPDRPITAWFIQADDYATRSDHEDIQWVVVVDMQEEADYERVAGKNFAAMSEADA